MDIMRYTSGGHGWGSESEIYAVDYADSYADNYPD